MYIFVEANCFILCHPWLISACCLIYASKQGRNQLFISGGNFHEISFDDVIVLIQPWYNFFANGHI